MVIGRPLASYLHTATDSGVRAPAVNDGGMSAHLAELPVVDLSGNPQHVAEMLREVAHEVGFFYLTGHGVPVDLFDEIFLAAQRLFELPDADKDAIAMINSPHFRGYTRLGGELTGGRTDWREQIDVGPDREVVAGPGTAPYLWLQGTNQWPEALPELRDVVARWDECLSAVGQNLLRQWAVSLGASPDVFESAFATEPATLMKVIRYPGGAGSDQGVGAHRDSGVLTLLLAQPGADGLEVEVGDRWIGAQGREYAFIVNIGELLEVATSGYLKATRHRVRLSGVPRISIAYFVNPRLDARMPTLSLPDELARRSRGVRSEPGDPIYHTYGENAWKSRLRAHPDVATAHGYG